MKTIKADKPFTEDPTCNKCGGNADLTYDAGKTALHGLYVVEEHLSCVCLKCGYSWKMKVKNG